MKSLYFLYHELRPAKSHYSYVTPCDEFQAHCECFAQMKLKPGALVPEITFDDGHVSDVRYALPALERHGLRATFFITAGWTGTRDGFMGWSQLLELRAAGHRIGAHGLTHKLLTACSETELETEISGARRRLEDGLGSEVHLMSLPGGRSNGRVLRACYGAGFNQIFTSLPRAEDIAKEPRTVGRLNLHAGTSVAWLEKVLDPASGTLRSITRFHQAKMVAQRILGDRVYASLWGLGNRQERKNTDVEIPTA